MTVSGVMSSELIELLQNRASVRQFAPTPIPACLIDDLLSTAVRAPTSYNLQAYALIVISEPERRAALAELTGQAHVAAAPTVVVVCADMGRIWKLGDRFAQPVGPEQDDLTLTSVIDASLAGMCLALAAESIGLGTVMVGAIRNVPHQVAELLELPGGQLGLFGICLGWPAAPPAVRPRLRADLVGHAEIYDTVRANGALNFTKSTLRKPAGEVDADEIVDWRSQVARGLKRARARSGSAAWAAEAAFVRLTPSAG